MSFRMPKGEIERSRWQSILKRIERLESIVYGEGLENAVFGSEVQGVQDSVENRSQSVSEADKESLIEQAAELGVAAPSVLRRWGVEKLKAAIANADG